jgi:hypothetical protein
VAAAAAAAAADESAGILQGDLATGTEPFLKFNDNHVSEADSLEDECFGGERPITRKDHYGHASTVMSEKNWNAYLLFYER